MLSRGGPISLARNRRIRAGSMSDVFYEPRLLACVQSKRLAIRRMSVRDDFGFENPSLTLPALKCVFSVLNRGRLRYSDWRISTSRLARSRHHAFFCPQRPISPQVASFRIRCDSCRLADAAGRLASSRRSRGAAAHRNPFGRRRVQRVGPFRRHRGWDGSADQEAVAIQSGQPQVRPRQGLSSRLWACRMETRAAALRYLWEHALLLERRHRPKDLEHDVCRQGP